MIRKLYTVILIVGASVVSAPTATARAQGDGQESDSTKACDKAAKTVENGHPAHKQLAALNALVTCGKAGAIATATALAQSRLTSDLDALTQFYFTVNQWRDADVMNAAMQLSGDPGAAVPARVFAVSYLLRLLTTGAAYSYNILIAGVVQIGSASGVTATPACRHGFSSDNAGLAGTPLPSHFDTQIANVLGRLAADPSIPVQVKNAAQCAQY